MRKIILVLISVLVVSFGYKTEGLSAEATNNNNLAKLGDPGEQSCGSCTDPDEQPKSKMKKYDLIFLGTMQKKHLYSDKCVFYFKVKKWWKGKNSGFGMVQNKPGIVSIDSWEGKNCELPEKEPYLIYTYEGSLMDGYYYRYFNRCKNFIKTTLMGGE